MLVVSIIIFLIGLYFFVQALRELIYAIIHTNDPAMTDEHDAYKTAAEIHSRLQRRYFATVFVHYGDHEYKFHEWSRYLLKKKGPESLVQLVKTCHEYGCEIIIEDDEELVDKYKDNNERIQAMVFHSDVKAMDKIIADYCSAGKI